jgi:hypothetical protein
MSIAILEDLLAKMPLEEALRKPRPYENDSLFRNTSGPIFYRKKLIEYFRTVQPIL